jgi:hypothetical protein
MVNAASYIGGGGAPGEIVTIFGSWNISAPFSCTKRNSLVQAIRVFDSMCMRARVPTVARKIDLSSARCPGVHTTDVVSASFAWLSWRFLWRSGEMPFGSDGL